MEKIVLAGYIRFYKYIRSDVSSVNPKNGRFVAVADPEGNNAILHSSSAHWCINAHTSIVMPSAINHTFIYYLCACRKRIITKWQITTIDVNNKLRVRNKWHKHQNVKSAARKMSNTSIIAMQAVTFIHIHLFAALIYGKQ